MAVETWARIPAATHKFLIFVTIFSFPSSQFFFFFLFSLLLFFFFFPFPFLSFPLTVRSSLSSATADDLSGTTSPQRSLQCGRASVVFDGGGVRGCSSAQYPECPARPFSLHALTTESCMLSLCKNHNPLSFFSYTITICKLL